MTNRVRSSIFVSVVSNIDGAGLYGLSSKLIKKMADKYDRDRKWDTKPIYYNKEIVEDRKKIYKAYQDTIRHDNEKRQVGIS